jgi:methionyl-tRNA formyltransferase
VRVIFMGSPPFGVEVLRQLLESTHKVVTVVTPPDRPRGRGRRTRMSPLAELAGEWHEPIPLLRPTTTREDAFSASLKALEPDALMVASYGEILRQPVLDLAPLGAFNAHASLLPRWRGAAPIQHALLAGDSETGVSVQRMVLALDAGDVVLSSKTPIDEDENAGELLARLAVLGGQVAVQTLDLLEAGGASFTPQDPAGITLAPKLKKEDGVLDWSENAESIVRKIRAFTPWPGVHTTLPDGRRLGVRRARPAPATSGDPGAILSDQGGFCVACGGGGALSLLEVQPEGKAPMDGEAFVRGARLDPDSRLGAA